MNGPEPAELVESQVRPMSPSGYLVAAEVLTERQAIMHPNRNVVSHILGQGELNLEIQPDLRFPRGSTLVLATDGLWDIFETERVARWVRKGDLPDVVGSMVSEIRRLTTRTDGPTLKADDLTIIAMKPK